MVISVFSRSSNVFTGAVCQTMRTPCSTLGEPSHNSFVASKVAALLPTRGSKGIVFCISAITEPSLGDTV